MRQLAKTIKEELSQIRIAYKYALKKDRLDTFSEWLADNYHILEREGRSIISSCNNAHSFPHHTKLPRLYNICIEQCQNGILPSRKILEENLTEHNLTNFETEFLPVVLKAALIHYAALDCRTKMKESTRIGGVNEKKSKKATFDTLFRKQTESNQDTSGCINAIKSLRKIQDFDFSEILENISQVEIVLSKDPSGIYPNMDDATRSRYRRAVASLAEKKGVSEAEAALEALKKASNADSSEKHIGYHINLIKKIKRQRSAFLFVLEILLALAFGLCLWVISDFWYLLPLLFLPLWEIAKVFTDNASRQRSSPKSLLRMELKGTIPEEARTIITVSTLLPAASKSKNLEKHLSELYRTNAHGAVSICVLADLKNSKTPTKPTDDADIAAAKRVITRLNEKYSGGFLLAVRPRIFSPTQKEYTGFERKRGAISALVSAIKGESDEFYCLFGDKTGFKDTKYIMALDSDTGMPLDTLSEIVSVAVHPLNTPIIDKNTRTVTKGYGVFSPRVETDIASASKTSFSRLLNGTGGITAYNSTTADRYQDMFSESIFMGKGLINVDIFHQLMKDRLPVQRILSHDILEGLILRTALVADVELTDSFPSNQCAFFDRLHRWIRGDWQNISYLFPYIMQNGVKTKNPLSYLSRYKIFDNLRRSLTPVAACIAIFLSIFMPFSAAAITVSISLICIAINEIFSGFCALFSGGFAMLSRLYYSDAAPAALANFVRAFLLAVMLAQTGYNAANAIVKALYRQFVSKKKLLEWVTAAQADYLKKHTAIILRCIPSIFLGLFLFLSTNPFILFTGILFLLNVFFALFSGKSRKTPSTITEHQTSEKLTSYAAAIWRFYDGYCRASENYLPPDNVQETPVHRTAHRTSPTNIGLMLCCILAARDLSFIDSKTLCTKLNNSLDTVDRLEKWHGNLLNWYDTKTLKSLEPKYVSSVDSGNFLCCLVALKEGLKEYAFEEPAIKTLVDRISEMLNACDITVFYNWRRKLFHIGYDLNKNEMSNSYYDLLMSEARMTSYYAISNRDVPKKHWGTLGRTLAKSDRYTGPISWTGTMFEYFMPHLFLPVYNFSLGSEALRFCLWCQKHRTKKKNIPYGISESGFYAFDAQLNYQYKAHGVQKLGLKRKLNSDLVISPYSTFLTLSTDLSDAIKNLKALENLQLKGRCGFYEAADFTKERTEGQDYSVVRSYMAHHLGMSMISILNALNDNVFQKRFMHDEKMASGKSLLEEKIPSGAVVFNDIDLREVPSRPERINPTSRKIEEISPLYPQAKIFSNREWTTILSDIGTSVSLYRGANITRRSTDILRNPSGIFAFAKSKDFTLSFSTAPDYNSNATFKAELSHAGGILHSKKMQLECSQAVNVHPRIPAEKRRFNVKNTGKQLFAGELFIYFEPSLAPFESEAVHPAFSKLFLRSSFDTRESVLIFERKARGNEKPLCLAVGFSQIFDFSFDTRREAVLSRPLGIFSLIDKDIKLCNKTDSVDNCAAFSIPLRIPPKSNATYTLILAAAATKEEAIERLLTIRNENLPQCRGATSPFNDDSLDGIAASKVLPRIYFYPTMSKDIQTAARLNKNGIEALWSLGVSGDEPIILASANKTEDIPNILPLIRLNRKLARSGIVTSLVILINENEGYEAKNIEIIRALLKKEHYEQALGAPGGIIVVNLNTSPAENITTLKASAVYIYPENSEHPSAITLYKPIKIYKAEKINAITNLENSFADGGYSIAKNPILPWCNVLCNNSFGTLVSDCALGYSWALNSRQNKLTPWYNDTMRDNCGEMLLVKVKDKIYDLIWGSHATFFEDSAIYQGKVDSLIYTVRVFVPEKGMKKVVATQIFNQSQEDKMLEICYYTEPIMGESEKNIKFLRKEYNENTLSYISPEKEQYSGYFNIHSETVNSYCTNKTDFFLGKWNTGSCEPTLNPCGAIVRKLILPPKRSEKTEFVLSWSRQKKAANIMINQNLKKISFNKILIDTPDTALNNLFNSLLPSQIINSRIRARTGFYQCGGAYGFRDQLQDSSALVLIEPSIVKRQILRCASVQFTQGDVLHWWHTESKTSFSVKGVRTRYSDDLLWLPFVTAEYVLKTGDYDFLETKVPYLQGEELTQDEDERYFKPEFATKSGSLYEHCLKAIERTMKYGKNSLPLIQGGDWNDSFNLIGIKGQGESVWLAQFLAMTLEKFSLICKRVEDKDHYEKYALESKRLKLSVDETAWDKEWYLRAFYDDGTPLGGAGAAECEIDLLPQAFSVLCDMPNMDRRRMALLSALDHLVDEQNGVIKLFTPPFSSGGKITGYVNAYPRGIRENGGQYTHAAVWLTMALFRNNMPNEAYKLLNIINPAKKYENDTLAEKYMTEPYALAGDVYSAKGMKGRGGWSLYTGSAGWFYRMVYEDMLGIKQENGEISILPCLPNGFEKSKITLKLNGETKNYIL